MKNKQSVLYLIPKASYYNSEKEVVAEANALHDTLMQEDRTLYTYLLYFSNATYFSKSLILQRLLKHSLHKAENQALVAQDAKLLDIEDALIHHALFNENITHALKMLLTLKEKKINNSRTSRIILRFLFERGNADFISIKYKQKIQELLIHALGLKTVNDILNRKEDGMKKVQKYIAPYKNPFALEIIDFVCGKKKEFSSEFLKEYVAVKQQFVENKVQINKQTKIPLEVLLGFNNFYKRGYNIASLLSQAVVSDKQKIQLQNAVKRQTKEDEVPVEIVIDYNKYSIMDLYKLLYNKAELTAEERVQIVDIITQKADNIKTEFDFQTEEDTAIIFDCSDSHLGSVQTPLHPLYKNLMLEAVLTNSRSETFYVGGTDNEAGLPTPSGDSDLVSALLDAVEAGYRNLVVLSDGFENVGSFDVVYKQLQKMGYDLTCTHFNPVFSPKNFTFKEISDEVTTLPFNDEKDIPFLHLFYLLNTNSEEFKHVMRQKIERELLSC